MGSFRRKFTKEFKLDAVQRWRSGEEVGLVTRSLLRRSLATLLISNGENVKVAQSQLRHTPKITLELYAQAVSADQQKAHKKVVQMCFGEISREIESAKRYPQLRRNRSGCPRVPEINPAEIH